MCIRDRDYIGLTGAALLTPVLSVGQQEGLRYLLPVELLAALPYYRLQLLIGVYLSNVRHPRSLLFLFFIIGQSLQLPV